MRYHFIVRTAFLVLALAGSQAQGPLNVQKVDPPNWYAQLPNPMLLMRGEGLANATFSVSDPAVHVTKSLISSNGHWAMVWLDSSSAIAEKLTITVRSGAGVISVPFELKARRTPEAGPAGFSSRDVLYLIMPDRFADGDEKNDRVAGSPAADRKDPHAFHGGDLRGVINHLDYLQGLGVTTIWLTPIVENEPATSNYHGYGATDLYAVEPRLGTMADYRELADALHRRHMKLVFDDVPNHIGRGHVWVSDPPLPGWLHGTLAHHLNNQYAFIPATDPHAAPAASLEALDGWFVNLLPDLNQQNAAVAQYLTQNMIWWIEEAGIDGLRIDTFPYVQREFWQQYLSTLKTLYPGITSIGEVTSGDPTVNAYFAGGRSLSGIDTHLTTPFDYPMYYSLLDALVKDKPMSAIEKTLRQDWLYPHSEALVPFISNHDQVRFMSQPGATPELLRLGFGLLLTMRGMPQLYAGDEIQMQGGEDPDNRRDFPGGFPGDKANAFTSEGRTAKQNKMHDWVAALGRLRAKSPALQAGVQQTVLAGKTSFAYARTLVSNDKACDVDSSMLIVVSKDSGVTDVTIPVEHTMLTGCKSLLPILGDAANVPVHVEGATVTVQLPPFGIEIFTLR